MIELINKKYIGSDGRIALYDIYLPDKPTGFIVFAHGYKGFKDWGAWSLVAKYFAKNKIAFIKFNFSHNGGTEAEPIDFADLDAFGRNSYSKELFDLDKMVTIAEKICLEKEWQIPFYVIGHSRGGGIAILHGAKDQRIAKIVSWAGVSDFKMRFPSGDELDDWKLAGVMYVQNGRTKQNMPHFYSFYEDFELNSGALNIKNACESITKPFIQIHGDMDLVVSISEGINVSRWTETRVEIIKGAGHTFQMVHPWQSDELPDDMQEVLSRTMTFLNAD
ncbi:MAG: alpha/beta hydrolase family protein [Crocinitomicaceae bacterium]